MTIKHMRIFIAVYQQMNISRAAETLHMTQPAVSRSIQELENYYGIRLFERIKHRLHRTESGDALYTRAIQIVESFDAMEKEIKNWDEFGTLCIGSSITLGNFFLPPIIREFQRHYPKLNIQVTVSNTETIYNAILDNQIDIAVVEGNFSSEYIHDEYLGEDRLVLILPRDHPLLEQAEIHLQDIIRYPLLLRETGSAGRTFLDAVFSFHQISVEPIWESTSTQALVKAVSYGIGLSILPEQLVLQDVAAGVIATRPVADEAFARTNHIVWHRQKYLTRTAKGFIELCLKANPKHRPVEA